MVTLRNGRQVAVVEVAPDTLRLVRLALGEQAPRDDSTLIQYALGLGLRLLLGDPTASDERGKR